MEPSPPVSEEALKAALEAHRLWLETKGAAGARADLAGACLRGLSLWRADLREAVLAGADLGGAVLDHARLCDASLKGARLVGASLWQADLSRADVSDADAGGAKLDHAVLRGATFRGTSFRGASLWGAHLEATDLSDALDLDPSQLEPASRDARTRLPAFPGGAGAATGERGSGRDEPVVLDDRRGMMAQRATEARRRLAEVEAQQAALRQRQAELERLLFAAPAASWEEAAAKARYLIILLADGPNGRDPRCQRIIADVLEDFERLSGGRAAPAAPDDDPRSRPPEGSDA